MELKERFLRYVKVPTMSDEGSASVPSTEKQKVLGAMLAEELRGMGLENARMDEHGYVYATLPANAPASAKIGFIAHMDTSPDAPDAPIQPRAVCYEGDAIELSEGIFLSEREFPELGACRGHELIVTDGKTLLGADDKAGIAIIMSAIERLITENLPHGQISIGFTPDEEVGRGADLFDVAGFGADYAYTVDGGSSRALDCETFNAASAHITLKGFGIHPGEAKGRMKNACLIAADFIGLLPAEEIPALTEGKEGFFHLTDMQGGVVQTELFYIIRDHDRAAFEARKETMRRVGQAIDEKWGEGTCRVEIKDSYYNMKEVLDAEPQALERALCAMRKLGMEPELTAIRGGTDGARLSFMGLPCPNLGTGGQNYHSVFEFVSVNEMKQACTLVVKLCTDLAEGQ